MTYCITCGHQIHTSATHCPQCGVVRRSHPAALHTPHPQDPLWLPLAALVCGLISVAALLGPTPWTALKAAGAGILITSAVALGCIAVARQERGQGLAIAGVALGAIGVIGAIAAHLL